MPVLLRDDFKLGMTATFCGLLLFLPFSQVILSLEAENIELNGRHSAKCKDIYMPAFTDI